MRPDPARGVFETLLLSHLRVQALGAHLARLDRSARDLYGLALAGDTRDELAESLNRAARTSAGAQRARIDVAPQGGRLDVSLVITRAPAGAPVTLSPLVIRGGLGAHKWCDRRLVESDGATPLIVDTDGSVLEAGWATVWILDGGTLTTPPLDGRLLPGITRARLLALAPRLGLRVREAPITLERARAAPTLFLTSSLRLAVPASFSRHPQERPEVDRIRVALAAA